MSTTNVYSICFSESDTFVMLRIGNIVSHQGTDVTIMSTAAFNLQAFTGEQRKLMLPGSRLGSQS